MPRSAFKWVLALIGVALCVTLVVLLRNPVDRHDAVSTADEPRASGAALSTQVQTTALPSAPTKRDDLSDKAYGDWTRAVVEWLVQRDDAESLAVAALAMRSARSQRVVELLERASQKGASNPALQWLALVVCRDVAQQGGQCDDARFDQRLRAVDSANAVLVINALERAVQQHDTTAQAEALAIMARAERFSEYHATVAPLIFNTLESVRVTSPPIKAGQTLSASQELALAIIASLPRPNVTPIVNACNAPPTKLASDDCRRVSNLLRKGDSYVAQTAGLNIAERLSPFGTIQASEVIDARRNLEWIAYQVGQLKITPNQTLRVLPEVGDEVEAWRALLREQGVAIEAPMDWSRPE